MAPSPVVPLLSGPTLAWRAKVLVDGPPEEAELHPAGLESLLRVDSGKRNLQAPSSRGQQALAAPPLAGIETAPRSLRPRRSAARQGVFIPQFSLGPLRPRVAFGPKAEARNGARGASVIPISNLRPGGDPSAVEALSGTNAR
jgi:hypothetical protein